MKKSIIILSAVFAAAMPNLSADDDVQVQALNREIAELRQKVMDESEKLEDCAKKVKGFQIAGGVTLGLTAVGVGVNVYQAVGRNKTGKEIEEVNKKLADAKKKLEDIEKAKQAAQNSAEISSSAQLTEPEKQRVKKALDEANQALSSLTSLDDKCEAECQQKKNDLKKEISVWEPKLSLS